MASQILEILRQGIWASLTGGWFYDPHLDVFCNTFHLYIWLFLLCFPFTIYLYFPLTLITWSIYCGSIAVLFSLIKLANHSLHNTFDTSECIQERVAEDDLPESEKKRAEALGTKTVREDEGMEMQVLNGSKPSVVAAGRLSFNDHSDAESIESFEMGARAVSSTIDLKVDVHRKNSSESSEESCMKKTESDKMKDDKDNLILKNSDEVLKNELRLKMDAIIQDSDFELSQSDCHIAKSRQDVMDTISECQISQSDNYIASTSPSAPLKKEIRNDSSSNISNKKPSREDKVKNNNFRENQNASCTVLTFNHVSKEQNIKNTGSLELPMKDDSISPREQGLLYWKQHHLEAGSGDTSQHDQHEQEDVQVRSETNIHKIKRLPARLEAQNSTSDRGKTLKFSKTEGSLNKLPPYCIYNNEHIVSTSDLNEKLELQILEENFDWGWDYKQAAKPDTKLPTLGSDEEKHNRLKFQIDSDDSSDNCGSRSPLLCRHQSLEKDTKLVSKNNKTDNVEAKNKQRITRTLSVDERCCKLYCGTDGDNWKKRHKSPAAKREVFVHSNKKLTLTVPIEVDDVLPKDHGPEDDLLSRSNERVGLDWLFEHTDSEAESLYCDTKINLDKPEDINQSVRRQSQGAIPKQRTVKLEENKCHSKVKVPKCREKVKYYSDEAINLEARERSMKCERENIIDEEDLSITQTVPSRSKSNMSEEGSSSSSTTEISSLLPVPLSIYQDEFKKTKEWKDMKLLLRCKAEEQAKMIQVQKLDESQLSPVVEDKDNNDSSTSSTSEISNLLPPPCTLLLATFLATRKDLPHAVVMPGIDALQEDDVVLRNHGALLPTRPRCRNKRISRGNRHHRSSRSSRVSSVPLAALASIMSSSDGTHIATCHEDTTQGAIHCFQDERGNWLSYTFDARGTGTVNQAAVPLPLVNMPQSSGTKVTTPTTAPMAPSHYLNTIKLRDRNRQQRLLHSPSILPDIPIATTADIDTEVNRNRFLLLGSIDRRIETPTVEKQKKEKKINRYYKMYLTPWNFVKVRFDRLDLIALFDRNLTYFETILSLILAVLVSICGVTLLNYGFYYDIFAFLFCFSMAGCQYCLIKSVQPDSSSPTHGYNRFVVFSRPIYFCLISGLIIILTLHLETQTDNSLLLFYNFNLMNRAILETFRDSLCHLLLFLPMLFSFGLFPQINTFSLYLVEQVDMHIFGGNAMCNLVGGVYCVFKSLVTIVFLYGFVFGALSETRSSQHILFSIFCSLLITSGYHLSRCSSDSTIMWNIVKYYLIQDETDMSYLNKGNKMKKNKYCSELFDNKSVDESNKSEKVKTDDKLSIDKNSQNNLLLNSNPSSNETLKTMSGSLSKHSVISHSIKKDKEGEEEPGDPLPMKLKQTVHARLKNDVIICLFVALLVFGIHSSTIFTVLQPDLNPILWGISSCLGFLLHYIVPQFRKQLPWLCLSKPVLRSHEHAQIEVRDAAKVMWFEKVYIMLCFIEKNIIYPILLLATLTYDAPRISRKFGIGIGALLTTVCGLKIIRSSFSNPPQQYLIVIFSALLFQFDFHQFSETFLIDYFFISIIFQKVYEFLLKLKFVVTYIAPWQITWGSAFHAFAQPFSVPHSAMLFTQALLSAVLSAPLNPFLGSAIFLTSYVRPIKFWERDYNTKRVDHSNTRLSSHLERNLGADDNNLNSIFYEHLTRSLQHSLCGDLILGRWGPVFQGDCFVLASDNLNCLVHIIEMGNGLVTFQMRGLEFRGTYCQQREVEAISEGVEENNGCCCCELGHLPHMLSLGAAFSQRWLAWELTATKYVLEGYSISDNSAVSMLQVFDFRKVLVTYYVKSIIFYCIRSLKLEEWLASPAIMEAFKVVSEKNFADLDPIFNGNIDLDYDFRAEGVTRNSFCNVYLDWIQFCASKRDKPLEKSRDSPLVSLCLALSLMGRRTLGAASHNTVSNVEFFLSGLHALFKGDFRITSVRDEWIFSDIDLLKNVVAPGVRMSLRLHQDHFSCPEEYEDVNALYEAICSHDEKLVISHEGDPAWRTAVLSGTPSLLALRHVLDDGADEYKIIMLNKRYLSFRVIKLNRECVRGLWAGQQQELVFLRNRNPERGSIQNAKQALRNMINSSCDQPIGYPIYVSPLTTSYVDTNSQVTSILGGPISLQVIKDTVLRVCRRIRERCREGCSSGSAANQDEGGFNFGHEGVYAMTNLNIHSGYGHNTSGSQSMDSSQIQLGGSNRGGSLGRSSLSRGSLPSVGKPGSATLVSLAGLLSSADIPKTENLLKERDTSFTFSKERQSRERFECVSERKKEGREREKREKEKKIEEPVYQRVRIVDPLQVYDAINLGRRIDVQWPDESMRARGGRSFWKDWLPDTGMEGQVVHRWIPSHRDIARRSHVDKTILLVKIDERFVPIAESGVQDLGAEV